MAWRERAERSLRGWTVLGLAILVAAALAVALMRPEDWVAAAGYSVLWSLFLGAFVAALFETARLGGAWSIHRTVTFYGLLAGPFLFGAFLFALAAASPSGFAFDLNEGQATFLLVPFLLPPMLGSLLAGWWLLQRADEDRLRRRFVGWAVASLAAPFLVSAAAEAERSTRYVWGGFLVLAAAFWQVRQAASLLVRRRRESRALYPTPGA